MGFFGGIFYYCREKARGKAKKKTDKAKRVQEKASKRGQCWLSPGQQKETDLEAQNNQVTEEEPR
jgi:hypothetical protein